MIPNPEFKYDSEDIDILVTGKGAEDFATNMATYITPLKIYTFAHLKRRLVGGL